MNIDDVQERVLTLVEDVPFGNSDTQNRVVIVNGEVTPYRALRHSALRVMNRLEALRECQYTLRRREIEIKILQRDLANETDELKRDLIALDIEQKRSGDAYTKKLIKDAIREIESLWPIIQALGGVSREKFEQEEALWYAKKHGTDIAQGDIYRQITDASRQKAIPDFAQLLEVKPLGPEDRHDSLNEIGG